MKIENNWNSIKRIAKVMDKEFTRDNFSAVDTYIFTLEIYKDTFVKARLINLIKYTTMEIQYVDSEEYFDLECVADNFEDGVNAIKYFIHAINIKENKNKRYKI